MCSVVVQWPARAFLCWACMPSLRLHRSPQHVLICVRITGDYTLAKDGNLRVCGFFSLFLLFSFCLTVSVYSLSIFQFTSYFIVKICSSWGSVILLLSFIQFPRYLFSLLSWPVPCYLSPGVCIYSVSSLLSNVPESTLLSFCIWYFFAFGCCWSFGFSCPFCYVTASN